MEEQLEIQARIGCVEIAIHTVNGKDQLERIAKVLNLKIKVYEKIITSTHLVLFGYCIDFRVMSSRDKKIPRYKALIQESVISVDPTITFEELV